MAVNGDRFDDRGELKGFQPERFEDLPMEVQKEKACKNVVVVEVSAKVLLSSVLEIHRVDWELFFFATLYA
jgi:hypothetical protein